MEVLRGAAIVEEHRVLMGTVVEKVRSAESGLTEACSNLLTGFKASLLAANSRTAEVSELKQRLERAENELGVVKIQLREKQVHRRRHAATARSSSGYRGAHLHPSGVYYAEIRSGDTCLGLGTFKTTHEAARAYDAAAWRLRWPRSQMNFSDMWTHEQTQDLAPPRRLISNEDRRLLIAEADEHAMAVWRGHFP
nr:ethylene-responsive transcription factor 5-like [Aegilops tauschii subsp. strangulata]